MTIRLDQGLCSRACEGRSSARASIIASAAVRSVCPSARVSGASTTSPERAGNDLGTDPHAPRKLPVVLSADEVVACRQGSAQFLRAVPR